MSVENRFNIEDLVKSKEKTSTNIRFLITITPPKSKYLLGFLEPDKGSIGKGFVSIPVRYLAQGANIIDMTVFNAGMYNQTIFRSIVTESEWQKRAFELIFRSWKLKRNEIYGDFKSGWSNTTLNGDPYGKIYFETIPDNLNSKNPQEISEEETLTSAQLLGTKFMRNFPTWTISPILPEDLIRDTVRFISLRQKP